MEIITTTYQNNFKPLASDQLATILATSKAKYPEALIAVRQGDYYCFYHGDARTVAAELEMVITKSHGGEPMVGYPYHSIEKCVVSLVAKGHKVILVDLKLEEK